MHEFERRLRIALDNGLIDERMMSSAEIGHDRHCGFWATPRTYCNCDPEIKIETDEGVMLVLQDGTMVCEE